MPPTQTSQAPLTPQTIPIPKESSQKGPPTKLKFETPAPIDRDAARVIGHRLLSLRARKWSVVSALFEHCKVELSRWTDAEIGQASAIAIEDLGILDAIQWYGGPNGNTTQFGAWVRSYLFEQGRGEPQQTISTDLAARFLMLSENYGLVANPSAACVALCRLAATEAFNDRARAYFPEASRVEPPA